MPPTAGQEVWLSAAVEGDVDEAVIRRLVTEAHGSLTAVYGKKGKSYLDGKIRGYNEAARFGPWVVLRDLDHDAECAPTMREALLREPAPHMRLRLAVRAVEAWLLGDTERMASLLQVPAARLPRSPEDSEDPKVLIVQLAGSSRSPRVRRALSPRPGSHRTVGPEYTSRMIEFAKSKWRPERAAVACPSLRQCRRSIAGLIAAHS